MKLSNIRKEIRGEDVALVVDVDYVKYEGGGKNTVWVSVPKEYGECLTVDRYDGFLVALLYPAMAYEEDIEVDGIVSDKLLHNITEYIIFILLAYSPLLKKVKISVQGTTNKVIDSAAHIGTGFSGGVDSFCTIYNRFVQETNTNFKIDTLVNLNVGNYYGKSPDDTDALFQRAYKRLGEYPNSVGLPYIPINSSMAYNNVPYFKEKWNFRKVHLLNTIAGVLTMQNYFIKHYFASAYAYTELSYGIKTGIDYDIAAFCDVYICQFLSTETLQFIPDGQQYTRAQKTERISLYPPTYDFLEIAPKDSFGKMDVLRPKSIRVLTTLDTLDRTELYSKLFDMNKYKRYRFFMRCRQVLKYNKDVFAKDNIDFAKMHGKSFPNIVVSFVYVFLFKIIRALRG